MKSFRTWTSRLIFACVIGVAVCFYFAYDFAFSCHTGKTEIATLQYPFICTDANDTLDTSARYIGTSLGIVAVLGAFAFERRKGLKFECWTTLSALLIVLIVMPLYALIVSSTGINTGYDVAVGGQPPGDGFTILTYPFTVPSITFTEQLVLTLVSTLAGVLSGPVIDKASKSRLKSN